MAFISGWVGVLAGYGALWQAGRLAGIAPWWLGPQTDLQPIFVIAIPYIAPLVTVVCAFLGVRASCYIGIVASLACAAIALGDLHFPGLAVVDGLIAAFALMVSVACLGGRMRPLPPGTDSGQPDRDQPDRDQPDSDQPDSDQLVHHGPPAPMGIAEQL